MGLFNKGDDETPQPWPDDDPDMPKPGRLFHNKEVAWWSSCRWCHGATYLRFRNAAGHRECPACDGPDDSGKSPFEIVKGDE